MVIQMITNLSLMCLAWDLEEVQWPVIFSFNFRAFLKGALYFSYFPVAGKFAFLEALFNDHLHSS